MLIAVSYTHLDVYKRQSENYVSEEIVEEIVSRMCKIPIKTVESNELESLRNLDKSLSENIYGQDLSLIHIYN